MLRREGGDPLIGKPVPAGGQRISDGEDSRIKHPNNVPGAGSLHQLPLAGHQLLGLGEAHLLASLHMPYIHACLELAGADAHKGDPVPVGLVHIGLDLEDKSGEIRFFHRIDKSLVRHPGKGGCGHLKEMLQEGLHAEIGKRRPEEDRGQLSLTYQFLVKGCPCPILQFDLLLQLDPLGVGDEPGDLRIIDVHFLHFSLGGSLVGIGEDLHLPGLPVVHAPELFARADGPVDGAGSDPQLCLNIIQKFKGIHSLPVHLVDEGENGNVAHGTYFE